MNESIKFIELFAGIGGFRYGLESVEVQQKQQKKRQRKVRNKLPSRGTCGKFERPNRKSKKLCCVYANEWDKYAAQIYKKHYGEIDTRDITTVKAEEIPDHDLLVGGFPCQAFSVAGKRKGFEDTRGTLFFEIARILQQKQPRLLLLENVKGLLSHDKGKTFGTILNTLSELGYDLQWQVLNSKDFGVPQNRERVFIVGHLRGTSRPEVFPIGTSSTKHLEEVTEGVSDAQRIYTTTQAKSLKGLGGGLGAKTGMYQLKDMRIRRLTPTECERLQGFPDGWTEGVSDTQRYKCLGNAVTTNVITAIGKKL